MRFTLRRSILKLAGTDTLTLARLMPRLHPLLQGWSCDQSGWPNMYRLGMARISNSPQELRAQLARAGTSPKVVLEATYGWYWAADTLAAAGAEVHLAHPLGTCGTQSFS